MYSNPSYSFIRLIPGYSGEVYLIKIPNGDICNDPSFYVIRYDAEVFYELLIHRVSYSEPSAIEIFPLSEGRFCVWSIGDRSLLLVKCSETDIKVMEVELTSAPTSLVVCDGSDGKSRIDCVT